MMSKIKSGKIANIKILVGIVLAISLITVFACEQKQSIKTEDVSKAAKNLSVEVDGHSLQISGDSIAIEKFREIISASHDLLLKTDSVSNKLKLTNQEEVFFTVEEMPEFPGGQTAFREFMAKSVKYPPEAIKKGIQGKVFINFVVDKDGTISGIKVLRGVDPLLDAEAIRVVKSSPKWKPGKQKGKEVAVQYTIPVNFALQ